MRYAVCVLVHNNPALLDRIVKKIKSNNVEVIVHLDSKCRISEYSHIQGAVFIKERVNVCWGGRSMIVAMLNLIKHVVNNTNCDYILFISGQDFPLVNPDRYEDFIDRSKNYIEYKKLPRSDWYMGGIERISHYYLFRSNSSFLSRFCIKMQKILNISRSYLGKDFLIYGGSQWININRSAADYIIASWEKYYNFFKYSYIPDEMIFHTILLNSPLKDSIVNTNLRFLNFEENKRNPVHLNESHYADIVKTNAVFCRKIKDVSSFDKLDSYIKSMI